MVALVGALVMTACSSSKSASTSTSTSATAATTVAPNTTTVATTATTALVNGTTTAAPGTTAAVTTVATKIDDTVGSVRGFDGTTITVAGIGIKGQLPGVEFGVQGRVKRFNDTNEIPGIKIKYTEYVDDKLDPATALSEIRRLVTDTKVFALVGDSSPFNPLEYLTAQKVPFFGSGYDFTYCANDTTTPVWGFGTAGCLVPKAPKLIGNSGANNFAYVKQKSGKDNPTVAIFSSESQSGKDAAKFQAVALAGAGFKVVFKEGIVPPPPVTDYTPYVQQLLTSNAGSAPDAMLCLLQIDCIAMYTQLRATGYKGVYVHNLYSDFLVVPFEGSATNAQFANLADPNPVVDQMKNDVTAVKADQKLETGSVTGYMATDMFIQALKLAIKQGKSGITPENIQKVASSMTWELKGFAGPTRFPANFLSSASCGTILESDGKSWVTKVPFTCSTKTYPVG
jgi:ABC-type branched-subunit amino acid transport system substrate-binding protein